MSSLLIDYLRLVPRLRRKQHPDIHFDGVELSWRGLVFSPQHYQAYLDFFSLKDARETARVHPLYFYVLGQRAQLQLLAHPDFPFAPAGLVHLSNEVELQRDFDVQLPYDLNLMARCAQMSHSGYELEIATIFSQQDQVVAINKTMALARVKRTKNKPSAATQQEQEKVASIGAKADSETQSEQKAEMPKATVTATVTDLASARAQRRHLPTAQFEPTVGFVMPAWAGQRYAKVSGDFNPIHLHRWSARLFGFKQPIAHGMYSLMRVVSVVERQEGMQAQHIEARFVRPVLLPSISGMGHDFVGSRCHFELTDENGQVQLVGSLS